MPPLLFAAVPPSTFRVEQRRPVAPPTPPRPACTDETPDCEGLCNGGNARACQELGDGNAEAGSTRNVDLALEYYQRACKGGHAPGCASAALLYEGGNGIPTDLHKAEAHYQAGCALGDRDACDNARQLGGELDRASPDLPAGAPVADVVRPKTRTELEAECRKGDWVPCLIMGRKPYTGLFLGLEGVNLALTDAARQRTGLTGGWGFGMRAGLEFLHFIPVNVGFRVTSSGDERPFSQDVVDCDPINDTCSNNPYTKGSNVTGATAHIETGLQHAFQLVRGVALAPGALVGYAGVINDFDRTIENCVDCHEEAVPLGGGVYVAGTARVVLALLAPYFRYERYLASDLYATYSIGLDFGLWASALAP